MRTIEFRGKVKYNGYYLFTGDWVFGSLIQRSNYTCIYVIELDEFGNIVREFEVEVHPETVGMFTGLHDKNGVKIFEGDRVKHTVNHSIYDGNQQKNRVINSVVFWSDFRAAFALQMNNFYNNDLYNYVRNGGDAEVIGNIHEGGEK